ncbi:allantoin permease [Pseudomonas sp. Choline-3u-10]|jgi:NCS1 family nucleobase:cation symporter-1|uniref:NCS1 family nucleobase:cation symporter-1 n=1 Tax=Pseudomonadaceae TaxID=135621 RepID=UPI000C32281D|nr:MULTISPECIES: NCS1 family nucleobase:cation symporter-1 [Pseudomonadaceae]MAL37445.1 allantoin permease [Pseudomonas sp.]MBU0949158.1 NCS1 family nucleobase:cation symporter-1 [Gammaproteobacteria bacterium]MBK3793638.1 NCS1 family nucleobase:cation symporter-1 [Stutzerimonas stutzeri]MBK3875128.1 NCS1 family nucleobase:cation symporter-1 [Stutzerimonas stutzeri]PKG94932.1 allantoin permease [Pseudomonas sp. Choline-3u-10]|tara:strand:- start:648 stop:2120 length:1473 start_codon:yes stop_codon:yes gene_type:complete
MNHDDFRIKQIDPTLYNEDLAPLAPAKRKWGWFEIFNVWSNDIQSLFGYTLAATLFISYGLNGWAVLAGIVLAGFIVMGLVQLTGKPSVKYGIPFPVMARASMGVRGANFPAVVRGIVAIFWYGVQTYFASTAVALLIRTLAGPGSEATLLGLTAIDWIAYVIVCVFQVALFIRGVDWVTRFLNWAGPLVYLVMIAMMIAICYKAGPSLAGALGTIFRGTGSYAGGPIAAFAAVVGTMVAYFAAVVINYGDFARFVKSERQMRIGNFLGLPVSLAIFSLIALVITAGTVVVFGETLTNPTDIVARIDNVGLTLIAAITFFAATVGINLVANFIPPAYDIANLAPAHISARTGGFITAAIAFFIGALWVSFISAVGIAAFVDTLGAVLAPLYGIIVADYYLVRRQRLDVQQLFSAKPGSTYYFNAGWNRKAVIAFGVSSIFSVASVWTPGLESLSGFAWLLGALFGAVVHYLLMRKQIVPAVATPPLTTQA